MKIQQMNCTAETPMPPDNERDQVGQVWMHHDASPVEGNIKSDFNTLHECPHCKHQFYYPTSEDIKAFHASRA